MTDKTLRESFRFFCENAGYCTPPGRAACAIELARIELAADRGEFGELGISWEEDWEADRSWMTENGFTDHGAPLWGCQVTSYNDDGTERASASLWGIDLGTSDPIQNDYARVIRAELLSELASELQRARAEDDKVERIMAL